MDGDRGDLAEFGKKRNTGYNFPTLHNNLWGRKTKILIQRRFHQIQRYPENLIEIKFVIKQIFQRKAHNGEKTSSPLALFSF